jgi:hypothetical protein
MNEVPIKPLISTPDLDKIDVRVETILRMGTSAERRVIVIYPCLLAQS